MRARSSRWTSARSRWRSRRKKSPSRNRSSRNSEDDFASFWRRIPKRRSIRFRFSFTRWRSQNEIRRAVVRDVFSLVIPGTPVRAGNEAGGNWVTNRFRARTYDMFAELCRHSPQTRGLSDALLDRLEALDLPFRDRNTPLGLSALRLVRTRSHQASGDRNGGRHPKILSSPEELASTTSMRTPMCTVKFSRSI